MKKFNLLYKLSFINYLLVLIARPYITAETWADIILILFIFSCIYQIIFILSTRKKEQITFLRSIADWFLNLTYVMDVIVIYFIITEIILQFGYMDGLTGAVLIIIGLPVYIVAIIYKIIYYRVNRNKKFSNKEK